MKRALRDRIDWIVYECMCITGTCTCEQLFDRLIRVNRIYIRIACKNKCTFTSSIRCVTIERQFNRCTPPIRRDCYCFNSAHSLVRTVRIPWFGEILFVLSCWYTHALTLLVLIGWLVGWLAGTGREHRRLVCVRVYMGRRATAESSAQSDRFPGSART